MNERQINGTAKFTVKDFTVKQLQWETIGYN